MIRTLAALALLLLLAGHGGGQRDIYWVFLEPSFARSALPPAVSADALAARAPLDTDSPIHPAAVAAVARTGARVLHASRWLRAVGVEADARTLSRIARLPGVSGVRRARIGIAAASSARPGSAAQQDSAFYGPTYASLRELNIPVLHTALNITGAAVRVGIVDSGFFLLHETLESRFVGAQRDFINNDNNTGEQPGDPVNQARHGTHVMSLLGGYAPNRFVGAAYGAHFYLAKVKQVGADTRADEIRWVAGVEWLDSIGVRIINSSIGFRDDFSDRPPIQPGELDGNTTITTQIADEAARRGILMVIAMGNAGPANRSLWAPADADSVLSVGAIDSLLVTGVARPADISSRGPTADGRTKPEVAARGGNVVAASNISRTALEGGLAGSSYAAPLIAGSAALFIEAWQPISDPSALAVRSALMLAGSDARRPNVVTGFGVPDVAAAIMMPSGLTLTAVNNVDLQGRLTTIQPTFRWEAPLVHPRMTPVMYRVEIAADSSFQQLIYSDTTMNAFAHAVRVPLRPTRQPVYWRVVARSPQGITRASQTTGTVLVPRWVTLLTLNEPGNEFIDDPRPLLSWTPLQAPVPFGPFRYDVQILSASNQVVQQVRDLDALSVRVPEPLAPNQSYRWRVIARSRVGVADTVESPALFVVTSSVAPPATLLYRPFPNPFPNFEAGGTRMRIWFDLARRTAVELNVYDTRGRLVRRLIPADPACGTVTLEPGLYGRTGQVFNGSTVGAQPCAAAEWDGTDVRGEYAPAGVYVIRLRADGVENVQRVFFRGR